MDNFGFPMSITPGQCPKTDVSFIASTSGFGFDESQDSGSAKYTFDQGSGYTFTLQASVSMNSYNYPTYNVVVSF